MGDTVDGRLPIRGLRKSNVFTKAVENGVVHAVAAELDVGLKHNEQDILGVSGVIDIDAFLNLNKTHQSEELVAWITASEPGDSCNTFQKPKTWE